MVLQLILLQNFFSLEIITLYPLNKYLWLDFLQAITYLGLIWWFWGVPIAEVPQQFLQPLGEEFIIFYLLIFLYFTIFYI